MNEPVREDSYRLPTFSELDRYNPDASYNKAPFYEFSNNIGLPLTRNLNFDDFVKAISGNNPLELPDGGDLPFYAGLPALDSPNSYQWDSFPAGEAQQFLTVSVDIDQINVENTPLNGNDDTPVSLEAISTSTLERPFTIATTVTPFNAGPIPHIHWAEDEWFIVLQGEIDSWVASPAEDAYELFEFPADENGNPITPAGYSGPPALAKDKVQDLFFAHLTPGQAVFLPRGYAHGYRNVSPTGEPLVFATIWARDIENGYPAGGIEEFFTLPEPRIGRFYDTSEEAAQFGSLYNKGLGSEEATANQQRFVDYINTFPDYYVALSGNFGQYLENGGNWNPGVYKDFEFIPVPPPDAWNPNLDQPWNVSPGDEGAEEYFPAPAPVAPSTSVNFATPLDPEVINRIYITLDDISRASELNTLLDTYTTQAGGIEGSFYSEPYQNPNNPLEYFIIEYWDEYSGVDNFSKTNAYQSFITQADALGTVSVQLDTIQPVQDAPGDIVDITAIGRVAANEGTRDEMIRILTDLQTQTLPEPGNITFEFYENPLVPNEWVIFQKYIDGPSTTLHFSQSYFKEVDSIFASLLTTGVPDITFYATDEPTSSFYQLQQDGLDVLTDLFDSAPELNVNLQTLDTGVLRVANGANTSGIGIVLDFDAISLGGVPFEYGVFTVDDPNGSIDGVNRGDIGYLEKIRERASTLFATNVDDSNDVEISRDIFVETNQHYGFYQVVDGSLWEGNPQIELSIGQSNFFTASNPQDIAFAFTNGLGGSAQLDGPIKDLNSLISEPQAQGINVLDGSTLVNKNLIADADLALDTFNRPLTVGFYPVVDTTGAVADPITGEIISTSDPRYSTTVLDQNFEKVAVDVSQVPGNLGLSDLGNLGFVGGRIYAPFITVAEAQSPELLLTYFPYSEANPDGIDHIIALGENTFAFEDSFFGGDRDFNDLVLQLDLNFSNPPFAI